MANREYGQHGGWKFNCAELLTENKQLRPGDNGKIFFCEQSSSELFWINLPLMSSLSGGWKAKFILKATGSTQIRIAVYGQRESSDSTVASEGAREDSDTINLINIASLGNDSGAVSTDFVLFDATDRTINDMIIITGHPRFAQSSHLTERDYGDERRWFAQGFGKDVDGIKWGG